MTRLILATSDLAGIMLRRAGLADIAIGFRQRFVWDRCRLAPSLRARCNDGPPNIMTSARIGSTSQAGNTSPR
ncbi:hypothetical protein ACVILL_008019 [Bradyrhizobium sp. USDA 3364]